MNIPLRSGPSGRPVAPTVSLPTGRAIVGGLLVAISALGIFAAHRASTTETQTNWLVIRRAVPAGTRITADDLALAPMKLFESTTTRAVSDPRKVIGRVALVPLSEGDLVLRSSTAASVTDATTTARRVGLTMDVSDAVGGAITVGDRVDVVAVPRSEGSTRVIVRGALVSSLGGSTGPSVGSSDELQLNLDVPTEEAARLVIDAHAKGGITLIAGSTLDLTEPVR